MNPENTTQTAQRLAGELGAFSVVGIALLLLAVAATVWFLFFRT